MASPVARGGKQRRPRSSSHRSSSLSAREQRSSQLFVPSLLDLGHNDRQTDEEEQELSTSTAESDAETQPFHELSDASESDVWEDSELDSGSRQADSRTEDGSDDEDEDEEDSLHREHARPPASTMQLLSPPSPTAPPLAAESDSSGDEGETGHELRYKNRVGAIPLEWYKDESHIGYDASGHRIIRKQQADAIDSFLSRIAADSRHTVYDAINDEHVTLTKDELASLQRIRHGGYAHIAFDPYADYDSEAYTSSVRVEAMGNPQEPKRRFIPSAWEAKRVVKLVRAMRNGWLRSIEESQAARTKKAEQQHAAFLMWGSDGQLLTGTGEERTGLHRMPPSIPPPKLALPGHAHSYNPPAEYLMTAEEQEQWRQQDPADRPLDFIPQRYSAMRLIPAYSEYVKERFERCLTGDHRVLTRSGWQSITAMRVDDEVLSLNIHSNHEGEYGWAMEWKRVRAVQRYYVEPRAAKHKLYRMQGSGMDIIATRDHSMLLARLSNGVANKLHGKQPVGYETVEQLLRLSDTASGPSSHTSPAHAHSRAIISAGSNVQPDIKLVVPGLERVCEWWWQNDQQRGLLSFLGFWLSHGWLDVRRGLVAVGQKKVAAIEWLETLLDALFARSWRSVPQRRDRGAYHYHIRCTPLYDYLRAMALGPLGYNPRDPTQRRSYPHFKTTRTYDARVAAVEQESDHSSANDTNRYINPWTEESMLAQLTGSPSSTRPLPSTHTCTASSFSLDLSSDSSSSFAFTSRGRSTSALSTSSAVEASRYEETGGEWEELEPTAGDERMEDEDELEGDDDSREIAAAESVLADSEEQAKQVAGAPVVEWNNGEWLVINRSWFHLKRWLGDADRISSVYSQLSRQQAIALLDGFCRADGEWSLIQYDDSGEPTGAWRCTSSSLPLIDHLMLIGQLAGAAVDLHLHTKAGQSRVSVNRIPTLSVDRWGLRFAFTKSALIPFHCTPLAQPVDVSDDIAGRGYYEYEDDHHVYDITVDGNHNFLTQRLCTTTPLTDGAPVVKALSGFVGNCLDLYLCPRVRRRKLHIDPQSLIPALPKPAELRPFPTTLAVRYVGHTARVRSIAVDSSGEWLASGAEDGSVRLWEVSSGRCFKRWSIRAQSEAEAEAEATTRGQQRAGGSRSGSGVVRSAPPVIEHVAFCPDVRRPLLSVCVGQFVLILPTGTGSVEDERTLEELTTMQTAEQREQEDDNSGHSRQEERDEAEGGTPHKQQKQHAVWSARRESGGDIKGFSVGAVRQEELEDETAASQPHFVDISAPSADADSSLSSVAAGDDGSRVVLVIDVGHLVTHLTWHHKGDYFATTSKPTSTSSHILIHRLSAHNSHSPFSKQKGAVSCCSFHPTQPFFLLAARSSVHVYHLVKQVLVKRLLTPMQLISSIAVHPSGDHVLVSSFDRKVCWFDLDMGQSPYRTLKYHQRAVRRVAFHPHYPLFASAADDGCVHIFHATVYTDLLTNALIVPLKIIKAHNVTDQLGVLDCCWHTTQPMIVTAGADHAVSMWR